MKKLKYIAAIIFLILLGTQLSFGQTSFIRSLKFDAHFNYMNKKRSYGVYSSDKYATSGFFFGYDLGLRYIANDYEIGVEYYSPFQHINASFGYRGIKLSEDEQGEFACIVPDIKLGYSPILDKVYYGFGLTFEMDWFNISFNRMFHIKSASSQYHGDGIFGVSFGVTLGLPSKKE